MTDQNEAITVEGLVKAFGRFRALNGVDLNVATGEVHAFLGPNGAGKSTTIRILLGLLRKDSGRIRLLGGDPWRQAAALHKRLVYVPGDVRLWPNLSGGETIDLLCALRGRNDRRLRDQLVERFELDPSKRFSTYSKGNRQKVAIIAAFASNAELFILDEPTSGLDPLMEAVFQEVVRERATEGATILLSSHILAEAEKLSDRVSIIRHGKVVESGTLQQLRHLTRTSITVTTVEPLPDLKTVPGVHDLRVSGAAGTTAEFQVESSHLDSVLKYLGSGTITAINCAPPTLEELFMRHYGDAVPAVSKEERVGV